MQSVRAMHGVRAMHKAQKMGDLSRPHDSGSGPCIVTTEVICRPRSAPVARTPINIFNSHRRRRCSLLNNL